MGRAFHRDLSKTVNNEKKNCIDGEHRQPYGEMLLNALILKGSVKTCKRSRERDLSLLTFTPYVLLANAKPCDRPLIVRLYAKWATYVHNKAPCSIHTGLGGRGGVGVLF